MAGDSKYGRLFTEMDLKLVATEAAVQLLERLNRVGLAAYGTRPSRDELLRIVEDAIAHEDVDHALTFPADEPLFLLRGQDEEAPGAVANYSDRVHLNPNTPAEHRESVVRAYEQMRDWQDEHPDRVKVPD